MLKKGTKPKNSTKNYLLRTKNNEEHQSIIQIIISNYVNNEISNNNQKICLTCAKRSSPRHGVRTVAVIATKRKWTISSAPPPLPSTNRASVGSRRRRRPPPPRSPHPSPPLETWPASRRHPAPYPPSQPPFSPTLTRDTPPPPPPPPLQRQPQPNPPSPPPPPSHRPFPPALRPRL